MGQIQFKKLDKDYAIKNFPKLVESVERIKGLTEDQFKLVLGLGLEIALGSDGTSSIFSYDIDDELIFIDDF